VSGDAVLAVDGLSVDYRTEVGAIPVLREVGFAIARGEALGLVGESGSGKTTIGLAVARLLPDNGAITAGAIRFGGRDLVPLRGAALRRARGQRMAMVYQDPGRSLNPSLRVGRQIAETLRLGGAPRGELRGRAAALLEQVHLPDPERALARYPHEFSGGQQQRIVIAMALANQPDLLILDEPTTGLDVTIEAEILDLFVELRQRIGVAILFISHNIGVIARMCDRVGALHEGRLVELAPTRELLQGPRHPYTRALLAARISFGAARPARPAAPGGGAPLIAVTEARKQFRSGGQPFLAVAGASLELGAGEVLGIVGESGSGKSTLARLIAGLLLPEGGRVALSGRDVTRPVERRDRDSRRAVQMVFQHPDSTLNPRHRIGRMLRRTAGKLAGAGRGERRALAAQALAAVRLEARHLAAFPDELSGGQRQRVAIARALIGRPRAVLCDEPTSALDVSVQATILELLIDLQAREAVAYLFISHDLAVVRYLADRIAVMYLGEIVEIGPAAAVFGSPNHPYTETLLAAVRSLEPGGGPRLALRGPVTAPSDRPAGCPFHPRCPRKAGPDCEREPPWQQPAPGHRYRCVIAPAELANAQTRARGSR
jgi:oligopeptide/dipeptide ABC transporter ATP-binding protein